MASKRLYLLVIEETSRTHALTSQIYLMLGKKCFSELMFAAGIKKHFCAECSVSCAKSAFLAEARFNCVLN
jgi:hypothetical protein